jgi:pimeloyl-ACP methyl ester carboxylesterase
MPPASPLDSCVIAADGIELWLRSRNGTDPPPGLLFVHATGFCKEVWDPVIAELAARRSAPPILAMDQRGHGDSGTPRPPYEWEALGDDVAAVLAGRPGPWIGVGHSSGGAALAMAEINRPESFRGLLLIEPIVFPGPHLRLEDGPMSAVALRRKDGFSSPEAAYRNFSGKGPFARWDDRALRAYVRGGLRRAGPDDWRLKCSPESEAEFYREGNNHGTWERLDEISCPVVVVSGAESTSHPPSVVAALSGRFREAQSVTVAGATHFIPMEQPREVAEQIAGFTVGLSRGRDH